MKTIFYRFNLLILLTLFLSCSSDDDHNIYEDEQLQNMHLFYTVSASDYTLEVYSENKHLKTGYNKLAVTLRDKDNNENLELSEINWKPVMHMHSMNHSAPYSELKKAENKDYYEGYIIFQMPNHEDEKWFLEFDFELNGEAVEKTISLDVRPTNLVNTQSFEGTDGENYVVAYMEPQIPKVTTNDMQAALFKMEDMMNFSVVEDFQIKIDPRMPSMGNHGSPNNQDLVFDQQSQTYFGKLSLTMTGYWKINLQIMNDQGENIKGEEVTEDHTESSLYFEIEF